MTIFRWPETWDPLASLRVMQREMDRLFGRGAVGQTLCIGGGTYPAVNVLHSPDEIVVQCELAGVEKEQVALSITGETLVVKGTKAPPAEEEALHYQRRERGIGEFSRTIVLPDKVDADKVVATLENGVLEIHLPKSEAAKPRKIAVQ